MDHLTKEQIQTLMRIEGKAPHWFGEFDLFVQGFGTSIKVSIALWNNESHTLDDRTVQTINELANLTEEHYQQILRLVFDDAMMIKEQTCYGDSSPPPETPPANWLRRIFWRPGKSRFVEISCDDPRHPLFGINSPEDIPARIKWESFCVDDSQETPERIAFLTCYPPWEVEHGREVGIRNGVPVGINGIELNPFYYVEGEFDEEIEADIRVRVWSGFHALPDVLTMLEDYDGSDVERKRLEQFARSEFQAKRAAEATWPPVTDCDRLDEAFDSLNSMGIIALHNAGYTMSDGLSDVSEALANSEADKIRGYCFYHEQDVGRAVDGYGLNIAYGDIADTASGKREIGQLVKTELERHGFTVNWDGNPETRLDIRQISWKRRTLNDS
jgi:hypothetical protein